MSEDRDDRSPIHFVQDYYGLSDDEMMQLFGTDGQTQERVLREHPEWHQAVDELGALMG